MTQRFAYVAYGADGRLHRGTVDQTDRQAAIRQLAGAGLRAVEVTPAKAGRSSRDEAAAGLKAVRSAEWTKAFEQLSVLLDAGFNPKDAIDVAHASATEGRQRALLGTVADALATGKSLSEILRTARGVPEHHAGLVAAGEESGRLADVVTQIVSFEADRARVRRELFDALSYPVFLVAMTLGAVVFLAFVLAPALEPLFEAEAAAMPVAIAALSRLRSLLSDQWTVLAATPLIAFLIIILARRRPGWRMAMDRLTLKIPLVGGFVADIDLARYSRTLSMLIGSGVPLPQAMRLSARSCSNRALSEALASSAGLVEQGSSLRSALARRSRFAPSDLSLVATGEEANRLSAMLLKVSDLMNARTARRTARFSAVAGPAITLILGALVGTVILSVMSALLSLNDLALR
ncbi:type II secretion system F family protein [Aquibium sp. ELW1220]|uniref:type II secretion system F family protein n=1 Tax=Aquibium sp. ELW1220 TaxID=2976766 RepID=UPI0025AF6B10|nr:type II secretion system F family protein [Aquibium sp. ELW1220]MDN2581682.1 type II secretion system F family protein [Aquibium sp. ELW1220]